MGPAGPPPQHGSLWVTIPHYHIAGRTEHPSGQGSAAGRHSRRRRTGFSGSHTLRDVYRFWACRSLMGRMRTASLSTGCDVLCVTRGLWAFCSASRIWGFHGCRDSFCSLLGYDTVQLEKWAPMVHRNILPPSSVQVWRWRLCVSPKCCYPHTKPCSFVVLKYNVYIQIVSYRLFLICVYVQISSSLRIPALHGVICLWPFEVPSQFSPTFFLLCNIFANLLFSSWSQPSCWVFSS